MDTIINKNMPESGEVSPYTAGWNYYELLAKATFIVYIFFVYFGTAMPFRESAESVDDIATSNIVNQVVFSTLFITALISLIPKWKEFVRLIKAEKIFTIFLIWCGLTIIWSDHSFVSFKRYFQIIGTLLAATSVLLHSGKSEDLLKYLRYIITIYIIISIISVFTIPGAKDKYGIWRGLATNKNHLGQVALMSILVWLHAIKVSNLKEKVFYYGFLLISLILLAGSNSFTSLLTFLVLFSIAVSLIIDKQFESIGFRKIVFTVILIFGFSVILSVFFMAPEIINQFFSSAGKDLTLTGRTDLWADILREAGNHLIQGCGFQGYWVLDSINIELLYQTYVWLPQQAHNGYIDILNETGLIGLFLFMLIIANYFLNLNKLGEDHYWKWFVIATIIINFTESTFIRPQVITGVMFIFSYFALMSDRLRSVKNAGTAVQ